MTMSKSDIVYFDYAYEVFFQHIEKYIELNENKRNFLKEFMRISYYPAKSYYVKSGMKAKQIGFLIKGSAIDSYEHNSKKIINRFYLENTFITSIHSFITQTEASSDIQFCETTVLLEFDYLAYLNIKKNFPEINTIINFIQNDEILFYKNRLLSMQIKDAKQRLQQLLSDNPDTLDRFKMKYIATYLGIEHETLSRLKLYNKFTKSESFPNNIE
jgi:CRP-like cAMP-binding protein